MSAAARTLLSPDELKGFFSNFIYIADSTDFNPRESLSEKILKEIPELRQRSLPTLIRLAHGLLLEVCEAFDTGKDTFDFLKRLSPSVLSEVFFFARMQGDKQKLSINALGAKLGPYAAKLPGFNPDQSRYSSQVRAFLSKVGPEESAKTLREDPSDLLSGDSPVHYTLFNHLYRDAGKRWLTHSLDELWKNPALDKDLSQKIERLLVVDPDAKGEILKLVEHEQLNLHHDQTPYLRRTLGQMDLLPSECSKRVIAQIQCLDQGSKPIDAITCAKAILDCPRYRDHALVTDMISTMRENIKTHKSIQNKAQFEAARLASFEQLMRGMGLSQAEIDEVACLGMLEMSGGSYLDAQDAGPAFAVIKMLERHCAKEDQAPGRDYANRVFLLGLIKHSEPSLLRHAAALNEQYAIVLYSITGKSSFLKFVKNEASRDKVFG